MSIETSTTKRLDQAKIAYQILPHQQPVFTCDDAARERGVTTSQITKTMIGSNPEGEVYVILLPGDCKLKIKRVRQAAGSKKIELMPADQIQEKLGLTVGAISPVDLIGRAKFFIDQRFFDNATITISSGLPEAGIGLASQQLADLLDADVGTFTS